MGAKLQYDSRSKANNAYPLYIERDLDPDPGRSVSGGRYLFFIHALPADLGSRVDCFSVRLPLLRTYGWIFGYNTERASIATDRLHVIPGRDSSGWLLSLSLRLNSAFER